MKFFGKAYRYKDKVIGVCPTLNKNLFMVGSIKPTGSYMRIKSKALPLCSSIEAAQENLDKYAVMNGLTLVSKTGAFSEEMEEQL